VTKGGRRKEEEIKAYTYTLITSLSAPLLELDISKPAVTTVVAQTLLIHKPMWVLFYEQQSKKSKGVQATFPSSIKR
jgi:hypothetical protein